MKILFEQIAKGHSSLDVRAFLQAMEQEFREVCGPKDNLVADNLIEISLRLLKNKQFLTWINVDELAASAERILDRIEGPSEKVDRRREEEQQETRFFSPDEENRNGKYAIFLTSLLAGYQYNNNGRMDYITEAKECEDSIKFDQITKNLIEKYQDLLPPFISTLSDKPDFKINKYYADPIVKSSIARSVAFWESPEKQPIREQKDHNRIRADVESSIAGSVAFWESPRKQSIREQEDHNRIRAENILKEIINKISTGSLTQGETLLLEARKMRSYVDNIIPLLSDENYSATEKLVKETQKGVDQIKKIRDSSVGLKAVLKELEETVEDLKLKLNPHTSPAPK